MEKSTLLFLLVLFISFSAIYLLSGPLSGLFLGFGQPTNATWWNKTWHYRLRLDINSTGYSRTDWPIEHVINFTDNLPYGTFDINSTRLIEYDSGGNILYELPSQFDPSSDYDSLTNAIGELVFILNGTTSADANRTFYLYYDTIENGNKSFPTYSYNINYSGSGNTLNVNSSLLVIFIDTQRDENTSGMYRVQDIYQNVIFLAGSSERTAEYLEYSNYSHNVSFNLTGNYSFVNGTARVTVEQIGDEILFGDTSQQTNEAVVNKKYYFYDRAGPQTYGSFIKIKHRVTNVVGSQINRNSTPAGALSLDMNRTLNSGNIDTQDADVQNPYSWAWASGIGGEMVGILHAQQTGTSNYYARNESWADYERIGIHLNATSISAGSYIEQVSLIYFSGTGGSDAVLEFQDIRNRFETPLNIYQSLPEVWYVIIYASTNDTVYNRNETMLITTNLSAGDPYGFAEYVNATLDMGTGSTADDQTIVLYDDGTRDDGAADDDYYANFFNISNNANVTVWTINITTYDISNETLNWTTYNFNVTDVLNVTVNIFNDKPMASSLVLANISVRDYRQLGWLVGATINCSYNSTEVTNKTDLGDGNYSVNFTAPSTEGQYYLDCNATVNNNTGNNTDGFYAEITKTNVSINAIPPNITLSGITLYQNETFEVSINASNTKNGTAYSSNITLELPTLWVSVPSSASCGDIEKSSFCLSGFNITAPENTSPSTYFVNFTVEWGNPDSSNSSNQTTMNVTVNPAAEINVSKNFTYGQGADGTSINVGNFTVFSIGNSLLQNISFNCYQGVVCSTFNVNFTPTNISSLDVDANLSVAINVSVPLAYSAGNYTGMINVSSDNGGFELLELNITVPNNTTVNVTLAPPSFIAYFVTLYNSQTFELNISLNDIENGSARYSNMSLAIPTGWISTSLLENCSNLTANEICLRPFNITIPNGTAAGYYLINVTSNWTNNDGSLGINNNTLNVTVADVPIIDVYESNVSGTVGDGEAAYLGNFTVLSIGNGLAENITFNCTQGIVCNNFTPEFTPPNISSLAIGENQSVSINVTVPLGFIVGNYSGYLNVSAENDNYTVISVNVTVPSNRTWDLSTTFCQKSEYPDEGTACEVTVYNQGNDNITINITPAQGNYTEVNITNFNVTAGINYTFNVTYNVTNVTQAPYNSTFIVDALQTNSNPDNMTLIISLLPYQPPIINVSITPNTTEQNSVVLILANITDMSTSGLKWTNATIVTPDLEIDNVNMTLYNSSGTFYQYNLTYPNGFGNTTPKGSYNVTVYAEDLIGNADNFTKNFTVYTNLVVTSETLSSNYLQGDVGSIYYKVTNLSDIGIENVNVSFYIYDSSNNVSYFSEHQTQFDGYIIPLPTFELSSDAVTGNYTLVTNSTYYDSDVNMVVTKQTNSTFTVQQRTVTVTGLFADIETAVIWYPDNQMRFGILVYNGEGRPVDPDSINLTVYDPDEDLYFTDIVDAGDKVSEGYYTYEQTLTPATVNGMYLAVVNITQGQFFTTEIRAFRVASGGPYDVRITPFEFEVPQGDFFDFEIVVENKGTVSQDVYIEYNVYDINDTNFTNSYFYASEAVYTPSLSNQSFTRAVYVFSDQPLGNYLLVAKVTFDIIQPSILANSTFRVIEGMVIPTTTTIPGPAAPAFPPSALAPVYIKPEAKLTASLLITGYNSNVSLARGFSKIESVTVKNDGRTTLNNVGLYVLGIPTGWFTVNPVQYDSLASDNSTVFLVEYDIPETALPGQYRANLLATSGIVSDQKSITINVFESIKELLESEIKKLREELIELQVDTRFAEKEGKDVSSVLLYINMTKSYIEGAEEDIENDNPEGAMDKISNAINMIKKARDLLDQLELPEVPPFAIPMWMILIIFLGIVVVVFIVVFWKRKKLKPMIRPYIANISKLVEGVKKKEVSKEVLEKERQKLKRMLKILDKEKQEGIITSSAYTKMKKTIENKLNKIEKKLK